MVNFFFSDEIPIPDSDKTLTVEFNDETMQLVTDFTSALVNSRELTNLAEVDIAHPYTVMYMSLFDYSAEKAITSAFATAKQYLYQAMDDAYLMAMTFSNFDIDVSRPGKLVPRIPTELPEDWHNQDKLNKRRVLVGDLPLPPINEKAIAEIRLAYLRVWQQKYPDFRNAALERLKIAVNAFAVEAGKAAVKTDRAGFRPGGVGGNLDGSAGADDTPGESASVSASPVSGSDEVSGRKPKGKRSGAAQSGEGIQAQTPRLS